MTTQVHKRRGFARKLVASNSDDDHPDAEWTSSNSGRQRQRQDSGFYADYGHVASPKGTGNSSGTRRGNHVRRTLVDEDEASSDDDLYSSDSDDKGNLSNSSLLLASNAGETASVSHIPPSPPPSPATRRPAYRKRQSSHVLAPPPPQPQPLPQPQHAPFTKSTPFAPPTRLPAVVEEKRAFGKEMAFMIVFSCISCVACMTIPPSSYWIRFMYSIGGLYLSLPTVAMISLAWGAALNSYREYIGIIISTKEFMTVVVLLSQTYFMIRALPFMFLVFDQIRHYDALGIGSLSVWSIVSSTTVATFALATMSLGLLAVEISYLVFRILAPYL